MLHLGCERRFGKNKKFIHLEILPEEIGDIRFCDVDLVGDAKLNLKNLTDMVKAKGY
jgi:thiamine pyrophosphate-dependent acetolactate synthase large subunit-like protein